jgi:hypothetical protein
MPYYKLLYTLTQKSFEMNPPLSLHAAIARVSSSR